MNGLQVKIKIKYQKNGIERFIKLSRTSAKARVDGKMTPEVFRSEIPFNHRDSSVYSRVLYSGTFIIGNLQANMASQHNMQ